MLTIQHLSYIHANKDLLFSNVNLTLNATEKIALIGNNGAGKSTLLKIIAGALHPAGGVLQITAKPYYVPQISGQYNHLTIAEALKVDHKLHALHEILKGNISEENYDLLNEDWTIEERCIEALSHWQLHGINLWQKLETLSGGQKTKVFLAGITIHEPELILLDEPSNHVDAVGRKLLYDFIQKEKQSLIVVSHDRNLLNLLDKVCELNKEGITVYGGNYDFYAEQKQMETATLNQEIHNRQKALRKAKEKERETLERQQKLDNRGKVKQEKSGVARIMMNTLRNNAENSSAKIKGVHMEKIGGIKQELQGLRATLPGIDQIKFGFDNSKLHQGKRIFAAHNINFHKEDGKALWQKNLDFEILSGERINIKGLNGAGKTTLIHVVLGNLLPQVGSVSIVESKSVYIDQDYTLIHNYLKVYEQAQAFNATLLQEHEIKTRLNRFLFFKDVWDKPCTALSGGERMRLLLCCLNISNQSPDVIILDEPTNNLDIQNVEILTQAINDYQGTLIVVSHDQTFLNQINIEREIELLN